MDRAGESEFMATDRVATIFSAGSIGDEGAAWSLQIYGNFKTVDSSCNHVVWSDYIVRVLWNWKSRRINERELYDYGNIGYLADCLRNFDLVIQSEIDILEFEVIWIWKGWKDDWEVWDFAGLGGELTNFSDCQLCGVHVLSCVSKEKLARWIAGWFFDVWIGWRKGEDMERVLSSVISLLAAFLKYRKNRRWSSQQKIIVVIVIDRQQ